MATKHNTRSSHMQVMKPSYLVATLYNDDTEATPSGDAYIIEDVIEDTTSLTQDDPESNAIESEFEDEPLLEIIKNGKYQFTTEVGDTQDDLLVALCGFKTSGAKTYAPSKYKKRYAKIDLVFDINEPAEEGETQTYTAFILPKVQLNSKLTLESLNSNIGRIVLAGTGVSVKYNETESSPLYKDTEYTLPTNDTAPNVTPGVGG